MSGLEFAGGLLLLLGLGSRLIALPLTIDMIVAYITADREALFSIISNPDKFTAAAPYTFLVASLLVLIFGPGRLSLDTLLAARVRAHERIAQQANVGSAIRRIAAPMLVRSFNRDHGVISDNQAPQGFDLAVKPQYIPV